MTNRKYVAIVSLSAVCLAATLFMMIPTKSETPAGTYDPWRDVNDDGHVDILDAIIVAGGFGASGTPIQKASMEFDSGWINITDKCGQNTMINLGPTVPDWNSESIGVDIMGKTMEGGNLHRNLGLTTSKLGWNNTYGNESWDYGWSVIQTGDGGYAIAGSGFANLVKTDSDGKLQWNETYEAATLSVVQTSDGGYALAGHIFIFGKGSDVYLAKTDASGKMLWNETYGDIDTDLGRSVIQTSDGGYAVVGYTDAGIERQHDVFLVKTDASGDMQWNKTYGGAWHDEGYSIVQTGDGGYAIAGFTWPGAPSDVYLVKTDASGVMQWNKTYGGTSADVGWSLVKTADGGYAIAGWTTSFGAGSSDVYLVRTDASGNMQWNKTYGGMNKDFGYSVVQTADAGYAITGSTASFGAGSDDVYLVKTDDLGDERWSRTYGGTADDYGYSVIQTGDGGYAISGSTNSSGAGEWDVYFVKTDIERGLVWTDSTADTITLYRGTTDPYWNFVRVRIWKRKTP